MREVEDGSGTVQLRDNREKMLTGTFGDKQRFIGRLDFCEPFELIRVEQFNQALHKNKCQISTDFFFL